MTLAPPRPDVEFSPTFAEAVRSDGSAIAFTRSEARALSAMAANAGRLLTRNQLLDAISEPGSEKNDRNVDFLINRIRKKLGDSAKDPKFIATRYGEGYIWVGKTSVEDDSNAFVVIGPIRGIETLPPETNLPTEIAETLARQLRKLVRDDQGVTIKPDFSPEVTTKGAPATISIDLTFFKNAGVHECIVSARSIRTHRVHHVSRFDLKPEDLDAGWLNAQAERFAPLLLAKAWHQETVTATDQVPLAVAMHEALNAPDNGDISWPENDIRLRNLRREHPDDPHFKLLYATHLHTKYITKGRDLFYKGEDTCAEDEHEIEQLVLESLDHAQSRPELAVVAAKLLYFVDQGYKNLALEISEEASRNSTAVASTLTIVGQLRGFLGDTDAAVEYLTQAKRLNEEGTHNYLYVLVMLCQVLMAAGRREELAEARSELYRLSKVGAVFFEPIFSDPYTPSLRAKGVTLVLSRARARSILKHLHYVSARLYQTQEHRENALRTPVNLFVRRFGRDVATDEIKATYPGLFI